MSELETIGESEQPHAMSKYAADGYRIPLGTVARRAAERLLDGPTALEHEQPPEQDKAPLANVYTDSRSHTVSFLLDDATANTVIYAVRLYAADAEAHAHEVRLVGATLPPDSYGAANRQAIASRHERLAVRLRTLERNYRHVVQ